MKDNLGARMKAYEAINNPVLHPHLSVFIRVDGKAFHTFKRGADRPFDTKTINANEKPTGTFKHSPEVFTALAKYKADHARKSLKPVTRAECLAYANDIAT
jgi:hypothetical protein